VRLYVVKAHPDDLAAVRQTFESSIYFGIDERGGITPCGPQLDHLIHAAELRFSGSSPSSNPS
jgi:hypothetical protein